MSIYQLATDHDGATGRKRCVTSAGCPSPCGWVESCLLCAQCCALVRRPNNHTRPPRTYTRACRDSEPRWGGWEAGHDAHAWPLASPPSPGVCYFPHMRPRYPSTSITSTRLLSKSSESTRLLSKSSEHSS